MLPLGAFFAVVQSWAPAYAGSLMGCIRVKLGILDDTPGPRIILVGGSNLPYAVDSAALSEAFGLPCVNLGATAYLGMDFYLSALDGRLREGDIVVLAPEFSMYRDIFSYTTVWMAVESSAGMLAGLPARYWPGMAGNFYNYAKAKNALIRQNGMPQDSERQQYDYFGFGPWGDLTFTRGQELTLERAVGEATEVNAGMVQPNVLASMNKFYEKAQKEGAQMFLTWAPYCAQAAITTPADILALETRLRAECDVPLISSIEDSLMDISLFYDSNNHLNSAGMALRTALLVEDLSAALG